jgi:hypothetical protein
LGPTKIPCDQIASRRRQSKNTNVLSVGGRVENGSQNLNITLHSNFHDDPKRMVNLSTTHCHALPCVETCSTRENLFPPVQNRLLSDNDCHTMIDKCLQRLGDGLQPSTLLGCSFPSDVVCMTSYPNIDGLYFAFLAHLSHRSPLWHTSRPYSDARFPAMSYV